LRFPKPLQHERTIGITGPSGGIEPRFRGRYDLARSNFIAQGFSVKEGLALHGQSKHVSAPKHVRAKDFTDMWKDNQIGAIIPPWGGELLIEILPLLDFDRFKASEPKWVMGYSDTSSLLLALTLLIDTATAHGTNFMDFIPEQTDELTRSAHHVLTLNSGDTFEQGSSRRFQSKWTDIVSEPAKPFQCDASTIWKSLNGKPSVSMNGRLIGGCLDVVSCLVGTPYGQVPEFIHRYRSDGVILYFENCEFSPCSVARALLQMRLAGWFKGINGIVFGRSAGPDAKTPDHLSYREAIESVLLELDIPVLLDADIGHVPPQMTLVNGALTEIHLESGQALVRQTLK